MDSDNFERNYFERWVEEALNDVPEWVQSVLSEHDVDIVIQETPAERVRSQYGEKVFGIFTGLSLPNQSTQGMTTTPTRIELYKNVFLEAFSDPETCREQVKRTVIHEIGHFMGMSESEIREKGY